MKKVLRPTGGAILDIDSLELGDQFLSLAQNVHTRKGFPSRINGRRVAYPVSSGHLPNVPLHLLNLFLNTFNWWLSFGASDIYAIEGSNSYDVSYSGQHTVTDTEDWTSTLLNDIPVFTNGHDPLLYWNGDGSSNADVVPDWPVGSTCRVIVAYKFHLFALNIDEASGTFTNKIMWSDAAEPGALPASWTPGADNEAGSAILADVVGECIAGLPLGAQLLVYKPTAVYPIEYAGQQPDNIFVVRPSIRSIGALGPHCVRIFGRLGDRHLVLGNDDVVIFDGINAQSVAEDRVKYSIANSIDSTYARNSFLIHNQNRKEVWVCIPESGSQFATLAHIWDYAHDTWVTRDLNNVTYGTTGYVQDETPSNTWNSHTEVWDSNPAAWNAGETGSIPRVVIPESNYLYVEDTADLTAYDARITRNDLTFDDETQFKLIQRITVNGAGDGLDDLQIRLGKRNSTEEAITWYPFVTRLPDGNPYEISGRFISLEIFSDGEELWTVDRITIQGRYNGSY